MNTTFTWSIVNIICIPKIGVRQNVAVQVNWECRARADVDGKVFVEDSSGTSSFKQFDPDAPFIEFHNLTEEDIYRWATDEGLNKRAVEERLQMLLEEQINPPVVAHMPPWLVTRI